MATQIDEKTLRGMVRKATAKHGTKQALCEEAGVKAPNLGAWLRGNRGVFSSESLSRIESALTKLSANGGKKQ